MLLLRSDGAQHSSQGHQLYSRIARHKLTVGVTTALRHHNVKQVLSDSLFVTGFSP